jgi:signal transduction histidine kinase
MAPAAPGFEMKPSEVSGQLQPSGAGATEAEHGRARHAQLIGRLTGGIVHDFNNIFTALIAVLDLFADAVTDRPELAARARLADETVVRGIGLASDLLALVRGEPSLPRNIDLNTRLADTIRLLRPVLGKQVELDWSTAVGAETAFADGIALMTAICYVAINARDAMVAEGKLIVATANRAPSHESSRADHTAVTAGHVVITITLLGQRSATRKAVELFPDLDAARDCVAPFGGLIEIFDETKGEITIGIRLRG